MAEVYLSTSGIGLFSFNTSRVKTVVTVKRECKLGKSGGGIRSL